MTDQQTFDDFVDRQFGNPDPWQEPTPEELAEIDRMNGRPAKGEARQELPS